MSLNSFLIMMTLTVGHPDREVVRKSTGMETKDDSAAIANVLNNYYFKGIYEGNTDLLRQAFDSRALLFGDVHGQPYFKNVDQYLDGVAHRESPQKAGKRFIAEIISIDVINTTAVAKTNVKMYDYNYWNFLTFYRIDGKWVIVNKTLSHVQE